jgi:glycosyltransferase involved in cell wall biosynthesis
MAEVVRLTQAGFVVSATDPAELASAILRMARSNAEREQFSRNAEAAFRSQFTLERMAEAYMNLYQDTARARRAPRG